MNDRSVGLDAQALRSVETLVVHDGCPDGMASAVLVKDAMPHVRVLYRQHNTNPYMELPAEPHMLFCDIVPPPSRVQEFRDVGTLVLDHHVKVRNVIESFGPGRHVYGDNQSGGLLAFLHVWRTLKGGDVDGETFAAAERFAQLASVRDTWKRQDSRWDEACGQASALTFFSADEWLSTPDIFAAKNKQILSERTRIGTISYQSRLRHLDKKAAGAYRAKIGDIRVGIINGRSASDVAEAIKDVDVVASFNYDATEKPRMIVSLRSRNGMDVGALAQENGGGGQAAAAAFSMEIDPTGTHQNPYEAVLFALQRALKT